MIATVNSFVIDWLVRRRIWATTLITAILNSCHSHEFQRIANRAKNLAAALQLLVARALT